MRTETTQNAIEVESLGHVDIAHVDVAEAQAPLIDVEHGGIEGLDLAGNLTHFAAGPQRSMTRVGAGQA